MMAQTKELRDPAFDLEKNPIATINEKEKQLLQTPNTANTNLVLDTHFSPPSYVYPTLVGEGMETLDLYRRKMLSSQEADVFNTPSHQTSAPVDRAIKCITDDNIPIMRIKIFPRSEPNKAEESKNDPVYDHSQPKEGEPFEKTPARRNLFPR